MKDRSEERGTIVRRTRVATWCAIVALGTLAKLRPRVARGITVALVATIGIAHGATDDSLLHRHGFRPRGGRLAISGAYGALAVATFVGARRAPTVARRGLFALSWLHFGNGDAAFARACGGSGSLAVETLVRGALPLCVAETNPRSRAVAAIAYGAALGHLCDGEIADALDLALPATLLLALPERLGFGIYFGAWHSVRHTALLLQRDPRGGTARTRAGRFVRESAGNVAIAVTTGALAYAASRNVAAREPEAHRDDVFGALILAITVPHQLAVWLFERSTFAA